MIPTPEQLRELLDYFGRTDSPKWTEGLTSEQETLLAKNILRLAVLGAAIHPEVNDRVVLADSYTAPPRGVRYLLDAIRDNSLALEEDT